MSHDVIYFPSEKYFSDRIYVCPMDPSEPSESRFVHRSQIASIGHICMNPATSKSDCMFFDTKLYVCLSFFIMMITTPRLETALILDR